MTAIIDPEGVAAAVAEVNATMRRIKSVLFQKSQVGDGFDHMRGENVDVELLVTEIVAAYLDVVENGSQREVQ